MNTGIIQGVFHQSLKVVHSFTEFFTAETMNGPRLHMTGVRWNIGCLSGLPQLQRVRVEISVLLVVFIMLISCNLKHVYHIPWPLFLRKGFPVSLFPAHLTRLVQE